MSNAEKEALRWYLQGTRDARTAGRNPVLGHSTLKLAERAAAYEDRFLQALDACRDLDVFYVPTLDPLAGNAQC